jgi:plastocyanin
MSNAVKAIIATVIIVAIAAGAYLVFFKDDEPSSTTPNTSASTESTAETGTPTVQAGDETAEPAVTISYTGSAFSPASITVNSGDTVRVTNDSQDDLDFDSDPHPVHTDNSELNVGIIAPGESKTFVVTSTGTWGVHNHLNESQRTTIVVK